MKKRTGFVSNSSSASFVINWKYKFSQGFSDKLISFHIVHLFDNCDEFSYYSQGEERFSMDSFSEAEKCESYSNPKDENDVLLIRWNQEYLNREIKETAIWIMQNTEKLEDGSFETKAFVSMMNDITDFDIAIRNFLFALTLDDGCEYEIIKTEL